MCNEKKSYEDSCVMPTYSLRPLTTESESLFWVSFAKERTDSLTTLIAKLINCIRLQHFTCLPPTLD